MNFGVLAVKAFCVQSLEIEKKSIIIEIQKSGENKTTRFGIGQRLEMLSPENFPKVSI